jgi:hypothetical protein
MGLANALVCLLLAAPMGLAHPHGAEEKTTLHAAQPLYRRTLAHCQNAFEDEKFVKRSIERRQAQVTRLKMERGLENALARSTRHLQSQSH